MDSVKIAHGEFGFSTFRDPKMLNSMLRMASSVDTCGSALVFNPNNDQRMVDYIRGAFALFGINVGALYYMYFVLLGVPIFLYLLCFWRNYQSCALLFACLCAAYTFMPSWVYQNNALISVSNQRFLSTLGIIPLLHILLLITQYKATIRWMDVVTVVSQAAFVAFAYAIRSSVEWMYLTVLTLTLFYLARPVISAVLRRTLRLSDGVSTRRITIAMLFAATVMTIGAFRMVYLASPCGEALNAHPVWHPLYYSLQFGPRWGAKLPEYVGLAKHPNWPNPVPHVDDATLSGDEMVYAAVQEYVERHHLPYRTRPNIWYSTPESLRVTPDGLPLGSWVTYESVVRDMFFEFVKDNPRYVLENFLIVKPEHFLLTMADYFATVWADLSIERLCALALMVLLIASYWPAQGRSRVPAARIGMLTWLLLLCFAWSSVPAFIFYTNPQIIGDEAFLAAAAIVIWIVYVIAAGMARAKPETQFSTAGAGLRQGRFPAKSHEGGAC